MLKADPRKNVAEWISMLLNAPLVASYAFIILAFAKRSSPFFGLISVVFATIIPLGFTYYLLKRGKISDYYASNRETRLLPFAGATLSYLLGTVTLFVTRAPFIMTALMFCYFSNTLTMMLINFRWKISIHASGITGPTTAVVYELGPNMVPLFLLLVPVAWARLKLKAHSLQQVLAGASLTIAITWLQLEILLNYVL
ncbi:hypothetical protein IBX38_01675 [Candidatus Bathyarchaeota archaeon]|nr:hypothetical protein [Candidatus Bathyarchaeota archaeon]